MKDLDGQLTWQNIRIQTYPTPYEDLITYAPTEEILSAFIKAYPKFREYKSLEGRYKNIMVSISGGADSDIMLDMIERIGYAPGAIRYVWFDTGMEYQATKDHLEYLKKRYGIKIERFPAKTPVPLGCKKYGVPFWSKHVSQNIGRLQKHGFRFENEPFDVLFARYPKCKSALRWWCNEWGENSSLNINRVRDLKEFMVAYPPDFVISPGCCDGAKKYTAHEIVKAIKPDLEVIGVRKSEGGTRSVAYTSCFTEIFGDDPDKLRPIFWLKSADKAAYDRTYCIEHSKCYTLYGLDRTGCACCPFGKRFEKELEAAKKYEPKLYKAANAVFGKSYDYTRRFLEFRERARIEK